VEILDASGNAVPGYTAADCDPINGDPLHHVVTWRGRADLGSLRGRSIRLRFTSRSTDLYAFGFRTGSAG
jgi:hypothetical protein